MDATILWIIAVILVVAGIVMLLRRNGWKGFGPVPWSHEPNRGFLRCVTVLAKAAEAIGEHDEQERCTQLLRDCDPSLAP